VVDGSESEELVTLLDSPRIVIGRAASCDLVLPDPTVSPRHATIRQRNAEHVIVDEGSTNGILVGGVRLAAQAQAPLRDRQLVRIGRVWLELRLGRFGVDRAPKPDALARAFVRAELQAAGEPVSPTVRVIAGPGVGMAWPLDEPDREMVVGRSRQASWVIEDVELSRRHLGVMLSGSDVQVRDLNSKRGSRLAGAPLGTDARRWAPGQRVELGQSALELVDPVPEALAELLGAPDERMRAAEFAEQPPRRLAAGSGKHAEGRERAGVGASDEGDGDGDALEAGEPPAPDVEDAAADAIGGDADVGDDDAPELADRGPGPLETAGRAARRGGLVEWVVVWVALAVIAVSVLGLLYLLRR
jgi:pSer/pThr/pTyr-binding forkhead associated (FHA) protein